MKSSSYVSLQAKCPFYKRETSTALSCSAFTDGTIIINFPTKKESAVFKRQNCYDIKKYTDCPLYALNLKNWEEKNG